MLVESKYSNINDESFIFSEKQNQILCSIKSNSLVSSISVQNKDNNETLMNIQEIYNSLPSIISPKKTKLDKPCHHKIEILKSDTQEIRNIIRKINRKTQTFRCDHNKIDRKYHSFESDLAKIYALPEMKIIDDFIKSLLHEVNQTVYKDKQNKKYIINILLFEVKKVQDAIIKINGKINEINAYFESLTCVKCEKITAEYEYALDEIEELRDEQNQILEDVAENKFSIKSFMIQQYPTINRIKLSEVCNKYKEIHGIRKTQSEITEELEETEMFRVTNSKNIKYVVRNS